MCLEKNLMKKKGLGPPKSLSAEAKKWWRMLSEQFEIDDAAGRLLLQVSMEALDSVRQAEALITREGATFADRFGKPRQHPAALNLRDSRNALLKGLAQLHLDLEPSDQALLFGERRR